MVVLPANLLFLTTLLLLATLGAAMQTLRPWPGLIVTELLCILLPAWLWARRTGSPAEALRAKWVGLTPCAVGLIAGACLLPLAAVLDTGARRMLGYGFQLPDSFTPIDLPATLSYVVAIAIAAPLCEEMVFRGYILHAYERAGMRPRTAILLVAALCTAWHLSLARVPGVALASLVTTYLAWQTGSVWPSVAAHFGTNATATLLQLAHTDPSPHALLPATALSAACLWYASRTFAPTPLKPDSRPSGGWWPLWIGAGIFILVAGAEVTLHHRRSLSRESAPFQAGAPSTAPQRLCYEIHAKNGRVGTAEYRITPDADSITLDANLHLETPNEWTEAPADLHLTATWNPADMKRSDCHDPARPCFSMLELPWRLSTPARIQSETAGQPIRTPAGTFRTIRVAIGPDASAWYDVNQPHTLIEFRTRASVFHLVARD